MSVRKNPPAFILVDKSTGEVVYTKRATGVGTEAINKCVWAGRARAHKTGRTYFVFLDISGLKVGHKISVPMAYAMGITEEISPGGSTRPNPRGAVRRNIFTFNNPPSGPADPTAARELELYIDNDSQLYHSQFIPIVKNLMLKRRKGVYNRELAVKLFMYLMDAGAKKYVAEFGTRGQKIDSMFNRNTRLQAARAFRDSFETEAELGNYDRLIGPVSNPIRLPKDSTRRVRAFSCLSCGRRIELEGEDVECPKCGQWYNAFGQRLKDPSKWEENPRRAVRKNIFTFNNPRKLNQIEQAAAEVGLYVTTWAPGDGVTRYRFHWGPSDYNDGSGIYTALGRSDALSFIKAVKAMNKDRKNPLNRSEIAQVINMTKDVARTARRAKEIGDVSRMKANLAYGRGMLDVSMTFGKRGTSRGVRGMLERYNKIESRESSRSNPVCSNPVIRGDKLPEHLKREVLNSFPYRWTKENEGRARYFYKYGKVDPPRSELISDEQWLREHAFHVTKAGKLDARHAHAEPHFMADDWKKGDPKPNPLTIEESREIEHLARRERIIGEQIQSPGSRGYHIGRAEGMRDIRSRYGRVRPNPLLQTVFAANPPASPAALKRQMIAFLKKEFRHIHSDINSKDAEFEIEGAIYWFANDYHGGGGSALYSILSTSPFKPGPSVRGPEEGIEQMMYDTLEQKYGGKKNPPISSQWDTMTKRQRLAVMEVAGYEGSYAVNRSWATLDPSMRRNIEQLWLDTTSRGGTTRRRRAVAVNPLTHRESTQILKRANNNLRTAQVFRPGHTRSEKSGQAFARGMVVKQYGPPKAKRVAGKVITRAQKVAGTTLSNPGTLRLPKPGTKMTVAQALELARRIGDKSLIAQCHQAMKLQKKANKGAKCVIWKTLAIGSPNKIDTVVALTHYGDSPETMYRPPKGSKKGPHMYRHKWGEGGGAKKTVPLLASADGKALLMPLDGKKIASDWLRH